MISFVAREYFCLQSITKVKYKQYSKVEGYIWPLFLYNLKGLYYRIVYSILFWEELILTLGNIEEIKFFKDTQ